MRTWTFSQLLPLSLLASLLLCITGCSFEIPSRSTSQTVLVISADRLGSAVIGCSKDSKSQAPESGFEVLCREFSRWTHAYTPSTLSVPALASMMSAEYPMTHGARHNGNHFLPASFETVAEAASAGGWETIFISGGAPVLRKSGLSQGFEVFEDSVRPGMNLLYRPFQQSIEIYLSQLKDIGKQSSLAWIYVPDLLFTKTQTRNNLGEPRNLSFESQLEQFDDDLAKLFKNLKAQNRWDSTTIIITGLSGQYSARRQGLSANENLFSEGTQVSLFVKWPMQNSFVSSDESVSLTDVGATLFEVIASSPKGTRLTSPVDFPVMSLRSGKSRWLPIESAWAAWHKGDEIKYAFRKGPILCMQEKDFHCFNSLSDREEILPLPKAEIAKLELNTSIQRLIVKASLPPKESKPLFSSGESSCLQMMKISRLQSGDLKRCEDPTVLDLAQWMIDDQDSQLEVNQKEASRKKFIKSLTYHVLDLKIDEMNQQLGLIWDISPDKLNRRKVLEEIFALPEPAKYRAQVQRSILEL